MANSGLFDNCENLFRYDVTILATQSVSDIIQTAGRVIVGMIIPAGWTPAAVSYNVGIDPSTMVGPAQDAGGTPYRSVVTANKPSAFPTTDALKFPFLQLVSVNATTGAAVNQVSTVVITLLLSRFLGGS